MATTERAAGPTEVVAGNARGDGWDAKDRSALRGASLSRLLQRTALSRGSGGVRSGTASSRPRSLPCEVQESRHRSRCIHAKECR
jgi:hypothetical protein